MEVTEMALLPQFRKVARWHFHLLGTARTAEKAVNMSAGCKMMM